MVKMSRTVIHLLLLLLVIFFECAVARRRRSHCKEPRLENREEAANMVFTGTVERLYRTRSTVYRGVVRVKRVIKGNMPYVDTTVIVEGFGDPDICLSDVRERDTRIFMVQEMPNGHLRLNSSLIRVSMTNLDRAVSAVKGLTLKKSVTAHESQCEKMYCAYGAQCLVDQRTQQAHCRCQETCISDVFAPVCGSDKVTYASECQLRMASCTRQKRIFTKHQGPCGLKNPCDEKACHFGAQCQASLDGQTAECICPEKCATFGDSRILRPVCGTDGKDYPNVCELRRTSCLEMREIAVRYKGKCDPCLETICPPFQMCQLDENRNPVCRCNDICIPDYKPVCGSDGSTYTNECMMRVQACKSQRNLRVIYSGECSAGSNPCELIKCGPGQECDIDRYGAASCQCPSVCEPKMKPVCGSNGRTYDNECELKRQSCLLRTELTLSYQGECGERGPCHTHHCSFGALCVVNNGIAICECPTCAEEFEPVCGTDGISYTNHCKLEKEACEQKAQINISHSGLCNGCDTLQCDFYAVCESDESGGSFCVCPQVCVKVDNPVCGTDSVSYPNECELRVEACKNQRQIAVATKGYCDQCIDVVCKYGARCENGKCVCPTHCPDTFEHVCSSNGQTYQNECEMRRAACQKRRELSIHFYGICEAPKEVEVYKKQTRVTSCQDKQCDFGGTCEFNNDGRPQCFCTFHCPSVREPICGTDENIHYNECRMREESCLQQRRIVTAPTELCSAELDIPCDGETPIKDADTVEDLYCGKGPGAKLCPPKTYCHLTEHFAKCCKETPLVKSCTDTPFGCCPDGRTAVQGPNFGGCPSTCSCNKLGSFSLTCDPVTKQCPCKPGVGGLRCDRCEPGYWGLHKISKGNSGCVHCRCHPYGSVRDDCDQMTGRCICKPGIHGMKCENCPEGYVLGPTGCTEESAENITMSVSCNDVQCNYGAECVVKRNGILCSCEFNCPPEGGKDPVCGTDSHSYGSECQLRMFSCRYQKRLNVKFYGTCQSRSSELQTGLDVTKMPATSSRRRSHVKRVDSKVTREVTVRYPENLYLTTRKPYAADATTIIAGSSFNKDFHMDTMVHVQIPSFTGYSYMEMYKLNAYTRLSLEMEFKTFAPDGILLYNGQSSSGAGDFISLTVKNRFIEFRYNLGSGAVVIRSAQAIELGKYQKIIAKRYLRDGILIVEGQDNVSGRSQGLLNSLDLAENLFIGFVPADSKSTYSNIGVSSGLIGCIRRLKIDRREVNLKYPLSKEIKKGVKIRGIDDVARPPDYDTFTKDKVSERFEPPPNNLTRNNITHFTNDASAPRECSENICTTMPCKNNGFCTVSESSKFECLCPKGYTGVNCELETNPCSKNPCEQGSTCIVMPQDGFSCKCPPERTGKLCNIENIGTSKIYIPDFQNNSYLELATLQNVRQAFSIELWFLSRSPDGVLLYNGQLLNGKGDFFSINLANRYVHFVYNLGSGIANITSRKPITLGKWHSVKISRLRRQGTLKVDNETSIMGKSKPPLTELNLSLPLYIGGVPNVKYLHKDSGVHRGLNGAIQRIIINGEVWGQLASRAVRAYGIRKYRGPPCTPGICRHGGICIPELSNYSCRCPLKYKGKKCEKRIRKKDLHRAISFDGSTFLHFPYKNTKGSRSRKSNRLQFRFRTTNSTGLIFWANRGSLKGDYLAVALVDGFPELSYNLGKQVNFWSIRSDQKVDDGLWHSVSIHRKKRLGEIRVDKGLPISNVSEPGATDLNINGTLWIGGSSSLPTGLPLEYYQGFSGCMDSILIDKNPLHFLLKGNENLTTCDNENSLH